MNNLAALYRAEGRYAEAEPLQNRVLEIQRGALGEEHPFTLAIMSNVAHLYRAEGKYAEAETTISKVIEIRRRVLGVQHPETIDTVLWLVGLQLQQQQFAQAEPLVREVLGNWEKTAPDGWKRFYAQALLGACLAGRAQYIEAEPLLLAGYEGMVQREAAIPSESRRVIAQAGARIVQLYESWGKSAQAAGWREQTGAK
jgi:tetratricopeptide (TPR) repeat protein